MIEIAYKRITSPGQLGAGFTGDDGLGMCKKESYYIHDTVIDLSGWPLCLIDEATAATLGASATFKNCHIRGAGKLILCGCGDVTGLPLERGRSVTFERCLLEDFGRRGVEAQDGMYVGLRECVVRNWGAPDRFSVRSFASWAHAGGEIRVQDSVFDQPKFWRGWGQMWDDFKGHLGQAWNDEGPRGVLRPSTYIPGVCKALSATDGGKVRARGCRSLKWWIAPLPGNWERMSKSQALALVQELEDMAKNLDAALAA